MRSFLLIRFGEQRFEIERFTDHLHVPIILSFLYELPLFVIDQLPDTPRPCPKEPLQVSLFLKPSSL